MQKADEQDNIMLDKKAADDRKDDPDAGIVEQHQKKLTKNMLIIFLREMHLENSDSE